MREFHEIWTNKNNNLGLFSPHVPLPLLLLLLLPPTLIITSLVSTTPVNDGMSTPCQSRPRYSAFVIANFYRRYWPVTHE